MGVVLQERLDGRLIKNRRIEEMQNIEKKEILFPSGWKKLY